MTYLNSAFAAVFLLFCNVVSSAAAEPIASFPQLHEKFLAGLKLVDGEKFGDAGDTFAELNTLARELKIQGLPDYSSELLDRAALLADAQRSSESAYIIRQAIQLSPSDPQTLFRASEFEVVLGHELALSYFFSG